MITAEELRILVRAETKTAVGELNKFRQSTSDTTKDLKKFATQLIGGMGAGYALKKIGAFLSDCTAEYYKQSGEVNKLAAAISNLKANIGGAIASTGFNDWLASTITNLTKGIAAVNDLRSALKGLTTDIKSPLEMQAAQIETHLKEVAAAIKIAEGQLAHIASGGAGATSEYWKTKAEEARAAMANLQNQKEYWEIELSGISRLLLEERRLAELNAGEAANQKMLQEEYQKTKEYAIEELEARIAKFKSFEIQGKKTITSIKNMTNALNELYIAGATQTEFNPLGMLPQTTGIAPSEFNMAGFYNNIPQIDFTGDTQSYDVMLASLEEIDKMFERIASGEIIAAQAAKEFQGQLLQSVGEGALQVGLDTMVTTMGQLADAFAYAGDNAQSASAILQQSFTTLMNNLSSVFLAGAYAAFIRGQLELGLLFLGLAGISAIAGGLSNAQSRRMAASSGSSLPSPSSAGGISNESETVIVNYNGDVFTNDEREATTLATVRRAGGSR